jgi:hypothetical protein
MRRSIRGSERRLRSCLPDEELLDVEESVLCAELGLIMTG